MVDVDLFLGESLGVINCLIGSWYEMFCFIWNGSCSFGKAEIVIFWIFIGLHESQSFQIAWSIDRIFC